MDVLGGILRWLKLESSKFLRLDSRGPWGMLVPPADAVCFHILERGRGYAWGKGMEPLKLEEGDMAMFPSGLKHGVVDDPATAPGWFVERLESDQAETYHRYSSDDPEADVSTTLIGGFSFSAHMDHPLLSLLPPLVYVGREEKQRVPWLEQTICFLSSESAQREQGSELMVERLTEMLFIQAIRSWLAVQPEGAGGWLGALRDEGIRTSLGLIHERPEEPWDVASLGRAVGMSRSVFAAKFRALVGESPLRYLTQWRMRLACELLLKSGYQGLSSVALQVGYDSEVSFSRAFKRHHGVSPGSWRRERLQ